MLCLAFTFFSGACAGNTEPDPSRPRANEQSSYILLTEESVRREATLIAWANLTRAQGIQNAPVPELQPVTLTLRSLPQAMAVPLYLPKVGEGLPMTEEETREALRRFITETGPLLCTDRERLSLIRIDGPDGAKEALYEQRPFRYPVRGGFGELRIGFAPDRRVLQIHSTCIPDVENIRRSFAGIGPRLTPEKAAEAVRGQTANYAVAGGGNSQTHTVSADEKLDVRELAIYPIARGGYPPVLEIHLVWEIYTERLPGLVIYLDVVSGEILGAELREGADG